MKNLQKGFVVPLLIAIIALLVIGGGVYIYENKKAEVPAVTNTGIQQSDQVQQQTNTQTLPVTTKPTPPTSSQPSITALSPTAGPIGTSVTITGSGFAATGNTISFGDWQSPNLSSSNGGTSITFTVPNVTLCYSDNGPTACQTYVSGSRVPATYNVQVSTSIVIGKTSNVLPFYVTAPTSSTAGWQTYLNENGGYTVKYPSDATINHTMNTQSGFADDLQIKSTNGAAVPIQWNIIIQKNQDGLTAQQRAAQIGTMTPSRNKITTDIAIDGINGKKVVVDLLPSDVESDPSVMNVTYIFILKGGDVYEFYCLNKITYKLSGTRTYDSQRFDQMLSSFKFTN
jgi:hypothetical protein